MSIFDSILLLLAKIGFSIFFFLFLIRWFFILPYLWLKYDRQIMKLKNELDEFKKKEKNKPVAQPVIDGRIGQKSRDINEKLDILETQRRLFLDRVNLFLSIISINKS